MLYFYFKYANACHLTHTPNGLREGCGHNGRHTTARHETCLGGRAFGTVVPYYKYMLALGRSVSPFFMSLSTTSRLTV